MYTDHRGGVRSQVLPACMPQWLFPLAPYIKVLAGAEASLAVRGATCAALVPEERLPVRPGMYVAVGLPARWVLTHPWGPGGVDARGINKLRRAIRHVAVCGLVHDC